VSRSRSLAALVVAAALLLVASARADAEGLTIARPGGAEIPFTGVPTVRCGPWEPGVRARSVFVELRNASRAWQLRAVLADVAAGQRIRFPTSITDAHPHGAVLFVAQRKPLIEASSNEEEASGWLAFSRASCRPGGAVAFEVHARLGSELFEGRRVRVDGSFSGTVSQ
jgi:hypothetical protein